MPKPPVPEPVIGFFFVGGDRVQPPDTSKEPGLKSVTTLQLKDLDFVDEPATSVLGPDAAARKRRLLGCYL